MGSREWYTDGLRFECTRCGACCTGPPGFVLFTDDEAEEIAARLGVTVAEFLDRYTRDTPAGRSLAERQTEFGFDCVFLDRESEPGLAVCSIHDLRPTQCRTFPFWPENLRSESAWRRIGRECEGVGRGALVPIEAIRIQRDQHR
ncbi:MAG: YkgJ family cysteine cluster protein [Planctomycetota bacterium]|nr:MAG: YkgJ family cysteine cluster protein [Planctomycetota bacterium]